MRRSEYLLRKLKCSVKRITLGADSQGAKLLLYSWVILHIVNSVKFDNKLLLRWLITVSSTFQDVDFDGS